MQTRAKPQSLRLRRHRKIVQKQMISARLRLQRLMQRRRMPLPGMGKQIGQQFACALGNKAEAPAGL